MKRATKTDTTVPSRVYYHGTSQLEWETIQRDGLIPARGHGADYWAEHSKTNEVSRSMGILPPKRSPAVYLAGTAKHAEFFATMAAECNASKPIILAVTLPDVTLLEEDGDDEGPGYRYRGKIPSSHIKLDHVVLKARAAFNNPFGDLFGLL